MPLFVSKTVKESLLLALLLSFFISGAISQRKSPSKTITYNLEFTAGEAGSIHTPLYSPYGVKVPLKAIRNKSLKGYDHLAGSFVIGDPSSLFSTQSFVVGRKHKDRTYNLLTLDTDLDGDFTDEQIIEIKSEEVRGKYWSSFSDIQTQASYKMNKEVITEPFPVSMWMVVENPKEKPKVIRFSRKGFRLAEVEIDELKVAVILSDGNNDGLYEENDWWYLRPLNTEEKLRDSRAIGDFAWLNGKAWKLVIQDRAGKRAKLLSFDPGMTEEVDLESRDLFLADKEAEKAEVPISFVTDHAKTMTQAQQEGKNYFIKFEAVWCGPCKLMDKYVYASEAVSEAANETICLKIDGDEQPNLAKKYSVNAYPTGILFDANGKELKRFEGYKSVREMTKFFNANGVH